MVRPENTVAAFLRARELGADGVELDVRRSGDARLVVHHDPEAPGVGLIARAPFAAVREARPDIPTLDEALEACAGMIVNVEIKCLPWEPDSDAGDRAVVRAVVDLLQRAEHVPTTAVIVSSFDLGAVDAVRVLAPDLATGWLTSGQQLRPAAAMAASHGHAWLNPDRPTALRTSREDIAEAHRNGVRVNVWTVDDPAHVTRLAAAGVDAIITNTPEVALETLNDRVDGDPTE
jgi:glycerophosphoryl diester phosphodiesterase